MTIHDVLQEFFEILKEEERAQIDEPKLSQSFEDLNRVASFTLMPDLERKEILNQITAILVQNAIPSKEVRDEFFEAVNDVSKSLEKLMSTQWGALDPELQWISRNFDSELKEIYKLKDEWVRPGRLTDFNRVQVFGVRRIYELLKKSKAEEGSRDLWSGFRIKQFGQFDDRKITSAESDLRINPEATVMATPSRMISNLAKGLGINISERTVQKLVKKTLTQSNPEAGVTCESEVSK